MDGSSNTCCDSDEGVDFPSCCFERLYEWVVFSGFFIVGGIGEFVVAIGEFYELYYVWCGWC